MRVIQKQSLPSFISSDTRSIKNFGTFLGNNPDRLGVVVKRYPSLSISVLTDLLGHTFKNSRAGKNRFQSLNAMSVEWQIEVSFIKKVEIVGAISGDGQGGKPVTVDLKEKYYDPNDSFQLENRQKLWVVKKPTRINANRWRYTVILMGNEDSRKINTAYAQGGRKTRYHSNYYGELSERGYVKYISSSEVHKNFLSIHRASIEKTNAFSLQEYKYIEMGKKGKESYYKLEKSEDTCLKHFLESREQSMLTSESNYDINSKCKLQDENGQDIPSGDGVITQLFRFADIFGFNEMSTDLFEDAIQSLNERVGAHSDKNYALICNNRFWYKFNTIMKEDKRFLKSSDNKFVQANGKYLKIGATFNAYEFAGTTFTVMKNEALNLEFEDRAFAIMLDLNNDKVEGSYSNINMFTLEGQDIISGTLNGMGGLTGKTSGEVSTPVSASSYHLLGYAGSAVLDPYSSVIFLESVK